MITLRPARERGHFNHGWLNTYHTFSFADYYDPKHMGFRDLRVINEDIVQPGEGFGTHPHKDMEIITYIVEGELSHKDSLATGSTISRGEVQHITAGRGILHSEFNHSDQPVHLLQIWILPKTKGLVPSYDQKSYLDRASQKLFLLASEDAREGTLKIHQDVDLYRLALSKEDVLRYPIRDGRGVWIQVVSGALNVGTVELSPGDGCSIEGETELKLQSHEGCEALIFDLI